MTVQHPRRRNDTGSGYRLLAALLASLMLLAACGDGADDAAADGDDDATSAPTDAEETAAATVDSGGGGGDDSRSFEVGGHFTFAFNRASDLEDFLSFQPGVGKCTWACNIMFEGVFDPLVILNPETSELVGVLAESWEVGDDEVTYTFHLREEATFHDGSPVTAADVKFSLDRAVDPAFAQGDGYDNTYAAGLLDTYDPEGTEIIDDHTIVIRTTEPDPEFLQRALARAAYAGIVPQAAVEEMGVEAFGQNPIGSGPFTFTEWVVGDHITISRNPDYTWGPEYTATAGGPPAVEQITFVYIPDDQTRLAAFQSGEVQGIDTVPAVAQAELAGNPEYELVNSLKAGAPAYLYPNHSEGHLTAELAVRQAISMAIDRDTLNQQVFAGVSQPSAAFLTENLPYANLDHAAPEYDPDGARAVLEEAGWVEGEDGIRERDGQRLELAGVCYIDTSGPSYELIEAFLREVGIALSVECAQPATALERRVSGDFDLFTPSIGWPTTTPTVLHTLFHSSEHPPSWNSGFYSNPEFDEVVDEARGSFDEEVRAAGFEEAQRILAEDVAAIPFVIENRAMALRDGFTGMRADGSGTYAQLYDIHQRQ